jgi:DNA-binding beta-propeller fold protein YncE
MKIKRILFAAALCAATSVAVAQPAPSKPQIDPTTLSEAQIAQTQIPEALYKLAAFYKQQGDYQRLVWTLQRLTTLQPTTGDLKLALATTYALQGEKTKAYDLLLAMQKVGYGYDLAKNPNFAKISETRVWSYIADSLKTNLKPFGEGKVAFSFPQGDTLIESLAYDPKREQFLAGSVRDGKIYLVDKSGKLQDFITPSTENGLWSVYGMAADPAGDALYVASTSSVYFKGFTKADYGKAGVFKFSLSTGKLVAKYLLAPDSEPRTLSSIAVGKSGLVFAADGLRNVIYRLDGGALKPMVENPKLTSLRGLAVSGDGKKLYFADYVLGVFGVDLAAGKGFDLVYDPNKVALGGIDGLYWYDNALVVIENGMRPQRVMRLKLGNDGREVINVMPLDSANPAFKLPTYGAVKGDALYFVANSQKNEYGTYGTPKDEAKLEAVQVFRSDLRFAWQETGVGPEASVPKLLRKPQEENAAAPNSGAFGNVEAGAQSTPEH